MTEGTQSSLRRKQSNRHTDEEEEPLNEPLKLGINRRIELPTFEGEDICEWLVCIEHYFPLARVATAKKLEYAALTLTGKTLTWFEWWEEQTAFST